MQGETRKAWVPALIGLLVELQGVPISEIVDAGGAGLPSLTTILAMAIVAYMVPNDAPKPFKPSA